MPYRETVTINVTEEDIQAGIVFDPCNCPVARALRRAFRRKIVSAGEGLLTIGKRGKISWYTPSAVRAFISDFDAGSTVKPFKFELSNPKV